MAILKNTLTRGARSKTFRIFLAVFAVFILGVAATFFYSYSSTPLTHAQSMTPNMSTVKVTNTTNSVTISLASAGPYNMDFRYEVCWAPAPNNSLPTVCAWSSWAASTTAAGEWSDWVWPGHKDEMQSGSQVAVQTVETRPLPPGVTSLTGVSVGIQLSEDNGGTLVGTNTDIACPGSIAYGGGSATAYAHLYGTHCNSNSTSPDVMRVYIASGGSMGALATSSNLPSSTTSGETVTSSNGQPLTITMQNVGRTPWTPQFSVQEINNTQQGSCDQTFPSSGEMAGIGTINDAPAPGTSTRSCSVKVNMSSTDYYLVHSGSTSVSPESIPISYQGVTQTITYHPTSTRTFSYYIPVTAMAGDGHPFAFIPVAYALSAKCSQTANGNSYTSNCGSTNYNYPSPTGEVTSYNVPQSWTVTYSGGSNGGYQSSIPSGQSYTFALNSMTAPATGGAYREVWQMTNGASFGNPYTWQVQVGPGATGSLNVLSVNSVDHSPVDASWGITANVANMDLCKFTGSSCSGTSGSYSNIPLGLVGISSAKPADSSLYSIKDVEQVPVVAESSHRENIFALSRDLLVGVANAQTTCGYIGSPQASCPSGQNNVSALNLSQNGQNATFILQWNPIAQMTVSPQSVNLTSPNYTATVQVSNTGATSSVLGWQAQNVPSWLTVTPPSDMSPGVAQGSSDTVTFSAATTTPGTYTGTVKFVGESLTNNGTPALNSPQQVTVTMKILTVKGVTISVSPTTIPVGSGATAVCTVTMSDGSTTHDCTYSSSNASVAPVDAASGAVTGAAQGTAAIIATSKQDTTKLASQQVAVYNGGDPACVVDPSSCNHGGGGNGSVTVQVTADPMVISQAETATCRATVQNATTTAVLWNAANGTITGTGNTVTLTPSTAPTATCKAVSVADPSASDSKTITVANNRLPLNAPSTTISASPTTILVPAATTIKYSASHVSSCTLSGGSFNNSTIAVTGNSASGTTTDHPSQNTVYTITCQGTNNYTSTTSSASVTVTVSNPGIHETNP